jgi:hypothetical protein
MPYSGRVIHYYFWYGKTATSSQYPSTNIRMIKSRISWMGHVACMGEIRNSYTTLVGNIKRRDNMGDLCMHGRI